MSLINENFLELQESYLFSTVAKKVAKFAEEHPDKKIIKLGIGDVTRPIGKSMHRSNAQSCRRTRHRRRFQRLWPRTRL